nr:hypothetical protein GCM10020093_014250 [Planobispora longispora]
MGIRHMGKTKAGRRERPGRKGWLRRTARIAGGAVAVLLVLAGAGCGAEAIAEKGDGTRHPMPGRLVDVGGHRLHLHCEGPRSGGPTVLLDAGWGESSTTWAGVRSALAARSVRACAYDRAGYAWSEPGPGPRDAGRAADELHTLLERGGETGPFVLTAHSYGGHVVRLLADRHPERVAGMVLVDVSDASGKSDAAIEAGVPLMIGQTRLYGLAARLGLVRWAGAGCCRRPPRRRAASTRRWCTGPAPWRRRPGRRSRSSPAPGRSTPPSVPARGATCPSW